MSVVTEWSLPQDGAAIRAWVGTGGVFAYPTEAVYGLGGDPGNAGTIERIIALKRGRSAQKGLLMVAGNWAQCVGWIAAIAPAERVEMARLGKTRATTFVLTAGEKVASALTDGETGRVALRISRHPVVRALCALIGQPLISTSANFAGEAAARSLAQVRAYFPDLPVVRGALGGADRPSRIIDWSDRKVLRA